MKTNYKKSFLNFLSANFIVRFISLLRELILAWFLGPSKVLDIFFFLISVPNLVNYTWNKALETTLQKRYELYRHNKNISQANIDLQDQIHVFIIISLIIYLILSISFPGFIYLYYKNYFSTYIMGAVFLINSVFVIETYILIFKIKRYSDQKFFLPSILPVIQSIILIIGIVYFKEQITIIYLSICYAIGGILQLSIFLFYRNELICILNSFPIRFSKIKLIFKDSSQLAVASGLSSLNFFVDQNFALSIGESANSYIHYGHYFLTIYLVLFVRNINTIFFPQFQKYVIWKKEDALENDVRKIIKVILIISSIVTIYLINNGYIFLKLLLGHGKVSPQDINIIYCCALGYSGAFLGTALNAIIVRLLHVFSEYRLIVWVAVINFTCNIVFNYIFVRLFGIWGICVSTSFSFIIIVIVYSFFLRIKRNINLFDTKSGWLSRFFIAICCITIFEGIFIYYRSELIYQSIGWNLTIFIVSSLILIMILSLFKLVNLKKMCLIF